jgi:hypothetical protein
MHLPYDRRESILGKNTLWEDYILVSEGDTVTQGKTNIAALAKRTSTFLDSGAMLLRLRNSVVEGKTVFPYLDVVKGDLHDPTGN